MGEAIERARSGAGPTLVESKVYRLSAHGNIIAPPGVPLHYPEHEAITVSATARSTRPRCVAIRCRASEALVQSGVLSGAKADQLAAQVASEMDAAVAFGIKSPFPKLESALENIYA